MDQPHRPGPLKQHNKPHNKKTTRSDNLSNKRVNIYKQIKNGLGKREKRNRKKQIRANQKRIYMANTNNDNSLPPHMLLIVPMAEAIDLHQITSLFYDAGISRDSSNDIIKTSLHQKYVTFHATKLKFRFSLVPCEYGDYMCFLDVSKVCDSILFIFSITESQTEWSNNILSLILAQGLPSAIHVVSGLSQVPVRERTDTRSLVHSTVQKSLPIDIKVYFLDVPSDAYNILRVASQQKCRDIPFRSNRPYMLIDDCYYDNDEKFLSVTGYLRGNTLSANDIVHISGFGDFKMKAIYSTPDPTPINSYNIGIKMDTALIADTLIEKADPNYQQNLSSIAQIDTMDAEQTWPTADDINSVKKQTQIGTDIHLDNSDSDNDYNDNSSIENIIEINSLAQTFDNKDEIDSNNGEDDFNDIEDYDKYIDLEDEFKQLTLIRAEKEDRSFPDEIDTPIDQLARLRFAKFRGLKSFRTSPWDPKENLPSDYAHIYDIPNFKNYVKKSISIPKIGGAIVGNYITLRIADFPEERLIELVKLSLVLFGLFPFEQKMTVMHFQMRRNNTFTDIIKSKDSILIHCGFRRYQASPIYSQQSNSGNKHKFETYFRNNKVYIASLYAPITHMPCPVLFFKQFPENANLCHIVATGSVFKADPNKVICKKIVLSGHPLKINKRSAVVRYMFFNREDVLWFKPVELHTKNGRVGNIKEPLGTHGHFKCTFDKQLKAHDTVLMKLYKRVYPKWNYEFCQISNISIVNSNPLIVNPLAIGIESL